MKRQRKSEIIKKIAKGNIHNLGGFLLNPPDDCQFKRKSPSDGSIWTDLGCCQHSCKERCEHYKTYIAKSPRERLQYLIDNGVDLIMPADETIKPAEKQPIPEQPKKSKYTRRRR